MELLVVRIVGFVVQNSREDTLNDHSTATAAELTYVHRRPCDGDQMWPHCDHATPTFEAIFGQAGPPLNLTVG